jgi:hypothetical protein
MRLQARGVLSCVVNRLEAIEFRDYHRMGSREEAVVMEDRTLGLPFVLDDRTPRTREWRWPSVGAAMCALSDIRHIVLSEVHVSSVTGGVGGDYRGESVVFVPVTDPLPYDFPRVWRLSCHTGTPRDDAFISHGR